MNRDELGEVPTEVKLYDGPSDQLVEQMLKIMTEVEQ